MQKKLGYIHLLLVQIALIGFYGCDMFTTKNNPETINNSNPGKPETLNKALTYELTTYNKQSASCANDEAQCAKVVVQYPFFSNNGATYLNKIIEDELKNTLYSVISEEKSPIIN